MTETEYVARALAVADRWNPDMMVSQSVNAVINGRTVATFSAGNMQPAWTLYVGTAASAIHAVDAFRKSEPEK